MEYSQKTLCQDFLPSVYSLIPSNGEVFITAGTPQGAGTVRIIYINGRVVSSNDVIFDETIRTQADTFASGILPITNSNRNSYANSEAYYSVRTAKSNTKKKYQHKLLLFIFSSNKK